MMEKGVLGDRTHGAGCVASSAHLVPQREDQARAEAGASTVYVMIQWDDQG